MTVASGIRAISLLRNFLAYQMSIYLLVIRYRCVFAIIVVANKISTVAHEMTGTEAAS